MGRSPNAMRRTTRLQAAVLIVMFGSIAVLPALPWLMGIVTDVQHSYTQTVPIGNKGTYLVTDDGVMQLYAWNFDPGEFPSDAPTLSADRIVDVEIVARAFDEVDRYVLYDLDEGRRIEWTSAPTTERTMTLTWAGTLSDGHYVLIVPTDSSFGGVTRHYFALASASSPGSTEEEPT